MIFAWSYSFLKDTLSVFYTKSHNAVKRTIIIPQCNYFVNHVNLARIFSIFILSADMTSNVTFFHLKVGLEPFFGI